MPATRYGTVTTTNPVTVTLDGEDIAVTASPINLGQALGVGDRVACEFRDKSLVILGSPVNGFRDLLMDNMRTVISGGGVRSATSTGVSWSKRFIALGTGRHAAFNVNGYFDMTMPPDGTVIPVIGHNSQTQATVVGGQVPLINWQQLWYDIPFGSSNVTQPSRYYITSYITPFEVPPTWLPVVSRNGDAVVPTYVWADGRETAAWSDFALGSQWVNYGAPYPNAGFRVENGLVHIRGLVKGGYITSGQTVATLPAGARPSGNLMFTSQTYTSPNVTITRVDVASSGVITFQGGQQTSWVSLQVPPFPADQ